MAVKAKTPEKKTTATKAAASTKKATTKRKYSKGQEMTCEVCGLAVTVDDIGGVLVEEDSVLLCCDQPMKAKGAKKAAKK
jgi:hypothetical protein